MGMLGAASFFFQERQCRWNAMAAMGSNIESIFVSIKKVLLLKICMFYKNVYLLVFKFLVNKH